MRIRRPVGPNPKFARTSVGLGVPLDDEDDTASGAGTQSSTTRRITPEVSANATEELVFDVNSRSRST
jgi:hypothetical protein